MKIIESFISIQGEGLRTGRPSIFIRLQGCNLRCVFRNSQNGKVGSMCDTPYASFNNAPEQNAAIPMDDVFKMVVSNPQVEDIVITGGEPMLFQTALEDFLLRLRSMTINGEITKRFVTIETNGTLTPSDILLDQVDLWSVSPKLSTSTPTVRDCKKFDIPEQWSTRHEELRINIDALSTIIEEGKDCQLKFVYTDKACETEIRSIADRIQEKTSFNVDDFIMLMPEGITKKSILDKSPEVVDVCLENGWTYTTRMHILIWGNVKEK